MLVESLIDSLHLNQYFVEFLLFNILLDIEEGLFRRTNIGAFWNVCTFFIACFCTYSLYFNYLSIIFEQVFALNLVHTVK